MNKSQRLRTPEEFRSVYKSKQFGVSELHSFNIRARDCGPSRLGVTVSKKVSKLAVQRNQIRRRIKEFYRLHQHQLVSADVVITAKANCSNATAAEQWQSLQQLWEKLLKWQRWHQANH
ncbi:MAG: ribonuclease P protein component [Gammaproteobacteria bacterium]|nr:ribonuclease P protein component [Gammaproteobacteria bacterium]